MKYRFPATISDVFERKLQKHVSGFGPEAVFTTESRGWYIKINDQFTIFMGTEKPLLEKGDKIDIAIIRKPNGVKDASPR